MAANEEAIGQLYLQYAARFPSHKGLWETMAVEEGRHAAIIRSYMQGISGEPTLSRDRFPEAAVDTFMDYMRREKEKLSAPGLSLTAALATSLYLEQSLLENKYFEALPVGSGQNGQPLEQLVKQTKEHADRIKAAISKNKTSGLF